MRRCTTPASILATTGRRRLPDRWRRALAFAGLCCAAAFACDVALGLSYDHVALLRELSMEVAYFAIPMALCAVLGLALRRWLGLAASDGALAAALLSVVAAPFLMFLPVLYFDCAALGACIG
ncbi:MAG TPA: hypothetical protein VNU97_09230 [Rhizomicrobium sp.]|jgi:hypothetical protein|nr:hypothetical protein [Rhizomicrobium sp.]